ncbi:vWA domain-containing protein [Candidatus Nanohalococcus occultus]|uniref:VWFA domain containing protein n=1 Tax=Candidatus Nanohalococcus occultus TaxID=2978047 RepID=A0ABY8CIS9_9ARCH|nr:vWFA domain containing protein [Candidatus Nanohaloarchaeota archaeon SVXNc]
MRLVFTDQFANIILLLNGLAILFYIGAKKKNRQRAMKFGNYETLQKVAGKDFLKSSHVMLVTRLGALTLLMIGLSNPVLVQEVSDTDSDYVLAIDSSSSMLESDIRPTRFQASKDISKKFVRRLGNQSSIGIVSFAGTADKVQSPTRTRPEIFDAIDSVEIGSSAGTAIGSAVSVSSSMLDDERNKTVVLITDGRNNAGISINESIKLANEQNVTVHTIGLGERNRSVDRYEIIDGENASQAAFPNLDVEQLSSISNSTGGEFTTASNSSALEDALINLEKSEARTDISTFFIIGAAILLLLEWVLGNTKYSVLP